MSAADVLILFTRHPRPGAVKTRLIPLLGAAGACALHRRLAEHAAARAAEAARLRPAALEVRLDGADADAGAAWLGSGFRFRPQGPGGLGARMQRALAQAFASGAERAVLAGSDVPGLGAETLVRAFAALERSDLVFGPAADGGYYLVGAAAAAFAGAAACFDDRGIAWGSGRVLAQSLAAAAAAGLRCATLETLADVDRPEDLGAALAALNRDAPPESLTVVVPAIDEEALVGGAVASALDGGALEVIVVDGGSRDATPAAAARAGARVLAAAPPRSLQMNAGAAAARGRRLLFLHADTRLPAGYAAEVGRLLALPGTAAGAFRLRIDGPGRALRLIAAAANLRSRLGLPYGDQALFAASDLFWQAGGFPPLPIMEDFALVRRLGRLGRIRLARLAVRTSARRWERLGALRTFLVNQRIVAAYALGVAPERLAAWYRRGGVTKSGSTG